MAQTKLKVSKSLINAVKEGNLEIVKKLVHRYGFYYCKGWRRGYTLLYIAIKFHHKDIAKFLLQNDAVVNFFTDHVDTPLHLASERGCFEIVRLLLEKGARVDAQNAQNEMALHLAAKEGYPYIVQELLEKDASVTAQTTEGLTPLFLAVQSGDDWAVQMLFRHARATFQDVSNIPSASPLENSTLLNHTLLCNPKARDKVSKLVVNFITRDECYEHPYNLVDELIDHGFTLSQDYMNRALLLAAVKNNYFKLVDSILRNGVKSNDGTQNPLRLPNAPENEQNDIAKAIRNTGLDADAEDIDAQYYLLLLNTAVKNGRTKIVKLFLNAGLNAEDDKGRLCIEEDRAVEVIRLLLANGADLKEAPDLLPAVIELGFVEVSKLLIESGSDVNACNRYGETALHESCKYFSTEEMRRKMDMIMKLVLNSGADVSIKTPRGHTAFHVAVLADRQEATNTFLNFGIDVDISAEDGSTPLHLASERGRIEIVEILLKSHADAKARRKDGSTPLHLTSNPEIVEILFKNKANVDACQKDNLTPLLAACIENHDGSPTNKIKTLLKLGADIDVRGLENKTALHYVFSPGAVCSWYGAVASLLDGGCDINVETDDGWTALDIAILRFRSMKGYNWFSPDSVEPLKALVRHMIKRKVARLYVSEKNLCTIKDARSIHEDLDRFVSRELPSFERECEKEVIRLKSERLDSSCMLYNVLVDGNDPSYAKNKSLMLILKSVNFENFPIYRSLISGNLQRSESRLGLLNSGQKMLNILVRISNRLSGNKYSVLPTEVLELIVSYLRNIDLNNLIFCVEALKSQLKC